MDYVHIWALGTFTAICYPLPMITGVQDFYYSITNRETAVRFYTTALQMKVLTNEEYWVALDCGGVRIGLHPEESVHRVPRDAHGAHGQGTLTLRSSNVAEDRTRIEQLGGKILDEKDQPWGHMLVFEDPDGNVLKLMNPK
jgi:catechol 2,3-dioxygenase-like lactoylglutathione lyase family enzyme